MATPRHWKDLGDKSKKRYLSAGAKQGKSAAAVRSYYNRGGNMSAYRGHGPNPAGVSERQWRTIGPAYRDAMAIDADGTMADGVRAALAGGMAPADIRDLLARRTRNTTAYHGGNPIPGRTGWERRPEWIEPHEPAAVLYWYH